MREAVIGAAAAPTPGVSKLGPTEIIEISRSVTVTVTGTGPIMP